MVQLFGSRNCGIALLNPGRTELRVVASHTRDASVPSSVGVIIPLIGNASSIEVVENRRSVVVPNVQTNPLTGPIHDLMRARETQCLMIVPLLARGEVIGTIGVATEEPDRVFTPAEVALAETIAGQVAGAVENARLFEETQQRLKELATINSISQALVSQLEPDAVIELVGEKSPRELRCSEHLHRAPRPADKSSSPSLTTLRTGGGSSGRGPWSSGRA